MHTEKELKKLGEDYKNIKAPKEIKAMTRDILEKGKAEQKQFTLKKCVSIAAGLAVAVVVGLNTSPAFACAMNDIPVLGAVTRFLTFRQYENVGDNYSVVIDGGELHLDNTDFATSLNDKYLAQGQKLYNEFMAKIDGGMDNIALQSEYAVKADNGVTISIEHAVFESGASGFQRYEYDTLDVQNELYITLDSLFADDTYIDVISAEILYQMEIQMAEDDTKVYFTGEEGFSKITPEQQFYIDNGNRLVIVFDEYAVAPGYMGSVEFLIPTEKISGILAGSRYIQ